MYGTVANIRVKDGQQGDLTKLIQEWNTDRKPNISGAVSGYMMRLDSDPQDMIMIGIFENKEVYLKNADDPEQDRWYQSLRALLEADPEWEDGEYVAGDLG